jgi:hypothetical protein
MTCRRQLGFLLAALVAAVPSVTVAQEAGGAEPPAGPPRPPAPKPRQARRRVRQRGPAEDAREATPPPEPATRLEAAPVPNRDLEGPRARSAADRARLSPSVIHRPLPGQGMAAEGAQNIQEERLFFPAPGARLNVPFSY